VLSDKHNCCFYQIVEYLLIISQLFGIFPSSILTVFIKILQPVEIGSVNLLVQRSVEYRIRGYRFPYQGVEHSRNFLIPSPIEGENGNHFGNAVVSFKCTR